VTVWAVVLLAAALQEQSLAEAAKRERERRQEQSGQAPARTFTDSDLPDSGPADPEPVAAAASPAPEPEAEKDRTGLPDDETERKQLERTWRARFAEARARLRTAESRAFVERVGVAWKDGVIPYQTIIREPVETEELLSARRSLGELDEEFRRTGLPPGWSRE
jgi:hypothetical protein